MPPKKGKEKPQDNEDAKGKAGFTEVDKTFLELELAEANRKNARLLQSLADCEFRNDELQKAYDKLDEDRADIIAYLKKTLNSKVEENTEIKERIKALEELREVETAKEKETVSELEKNFKIMKDQLTSENKLLAGKLNTLEEFRAIRDDLLQKFENQEVAYGEQEMKYKRLLYEAEKKFIIGKDKLKKEMEARLLQLAQDFQDATELRIAASTHRVIRENIAINNELDSILQTQAKLADQNEKFKESERSARIAKELAEEERDKAINKNVVQLKVIDQLTNAFQEVKKEKALFQKKTYDFDMLQAKIQKLTKENENLCLQVRILEQHLHAKMTEQNKTFVETAKIHKENSTLKKLMKEAASAIQAALKLDQWAKEDRSRELMDRQSLLARLLEIVSRYREVERAESTDTLASFSKIYEEGDLGFVPKPIGVKKPASLQYDSKMSVLQMADENGSLSVSSSDSSITTVKTIPSMKLMPLSSQPEIYAQDSLPSFAESIESSESEAGDKKDTLKREMSEMERKLEESKMNIQKSLIKDMTASAFSMKSTTKIDEVKKVISTVPEDDEEEHVREELVHFADSGIRSKEKLEEPAEAKPEEEEEIKPGDKERKIEEEERKAEEEEEPMLEREEEQRHVVEEEARPEKIEGEEEKSEQVGGEEAKSEKTGAEETSDYGG